MRSRWRMLWPRLSAGTRGRRAAQAGSSAAQARGTIVFPGSHAAPDHAETEAGWRAAEAAHALDPDSLPMESLLMSYLLDEGCQRPLPEALDFGIRDLSFRELRLRSALDTADRDRMWEEEARETDAIAALARFTRQIAAPARAATDPKVRAKFAQFTQQFLTLDWDGLRRGRGWPRRIPKTSGILPPSWRLRMPSASAICSRKRNLSRGSTGTCGAGWKSRTPNRPPAFTPSQCRNSCGASILFSIGRFKCSCISGLTSNRNISKA